jgi:hypothetical protein
MKNLNENMGGSIENEFQDWLYKTLSNKGYDIENEFQDWLDIMISEKGYEDEIETLKTVIGYTSDKKVDLEDIIEYAQETLRDYDIDNWVPQTGGSTNESKKMENLNEGKKKKMSYMAELAEIDKQSAIVAMEAKIDKLAEMIEAKTTRLNMVSEDENLSELIDKRRVKEMQKEIKILEKEKSKMEKMYEKMGAKKKRIVDEKKEEKMEEEMSQPHGNIGAQTPQGEPLGFLEEDGLDEAHCSEEDDIVKEKEETNEEVERFRKLAGLS